MSYKNDKESKDSKDQKFQGSGNRAPRRRRGQHGRNDRRPKDTNGASTKRDENSFNDLGWYAHYTELLQSAGMLAFPNKPGMSIPLGRVRSDKYDSVIDTDARILMPGIMSLEFDYTIGISNDVGSPASMAAKNLWGRVRKEFSGTMGFDAPDLFMFILAVDQLHAYISYLKRIYRGIGIYDPNNLYLPERLMEALIGPRSVDPLIGNAYVDYDYNDLVRGKVKLWNLINMLINMSNTFLIPDAMDIFHRHRWMNENVYADAGSIQSQLYVFSPQHFWFLDDVGETGTHLISRPVPLMDQEFIQEVRTKIPTADLVDFFYEYGLSMYSQIANWEEAYDINGRLQRVFEGAPLFNSLPMAQDEVLNITVSPEVLTQIHNATIVENFVHADVTQNPGTNAIIFVPQVDSMELDRAPVDMDVAAPDVGMVTIATRLTSVMDSHNRFTCGTEVVTGAWLTVDPDAVGLDGVWWPYRSTLVDTSDPSTVGSFRTAFAVMCTARAWYKAPMIGVLWMTEPKQGSPGYWGKYLLNAEITNLTSVDYAFLEPLNRACISSEFNCFSLNPASKK